MRRMFSFWGLCLQVLALLLIVLLILTTVAFTILFGDAAFSENASATGELLSFLSVLLAADIVFFALFVLCRQKKKRGA